MRSLNNAGLRFLQKYIIIIFQIILKHFGYNDIYLKFIVLY